MAFSEMKNALPEDTDYWNGLLGANISTALYEEKAFDKMHSVTARNTGCFGFDGQNPSQTIDSPFL
jgi:hypothetical protein